MNDVLTVDAVSKRFRIFDRPRDRLLEFMSGGRLKRHAEKWALSEVSFKLRAGESVALVGENGSGKSTLLAIVAGSRTATSGRVTSKGKVAALLELGMGFHPDFTGRQNAVMGLQIQGLDSDSIRRLIRYVIDFSELGKYFDRPLRTYSSGMQVRLAFSVATAANPDILIVDEALSVGDAYFQHKSIDRIRQLRDVGTSLLFVSHDAAAVRTLCDRAVLLEDGALIREGPPALVMDYYNALIARRERLADITQSCDGQTRSGSRAVRFETVEMASTEGKSKEVFHVSETAVIRCRIRGRQSMLLPTIGISIRDRLGNVVFGTNTWHLERFRDERMKVQCCVVEFSVRLDIGVGGYSVTVAAHTGRSHVLHSFDWWDHACVFEVIPGHEPSFEGIACLHAEVRKVSGVDTERLASPERA